jgi:uncharacterized repeat protein (TIGR03803 family)
MIAGAKIGRGCILICGLAVTVVMSSTAQAATETVLYSFKGKSDGMGPEGSLFQDQAGNLYGTTNQGGGKKKCNGTTCGTVYRLAPNGVETVLLAFTGRGGKYGGWPTAGLIEDNSGNLYGTASEWGKGGDGTVLEITAAGSEKTIFGFKGSNGSSPYDALTMDNEGNLLGTTYDGGAFGSGTIFKLAPNGTESVLYSFQNNGADGVLPLSGLTADGNGNYYGTTSQGGIGNCSGVGCGTVFKLAANGTESVVYSFQGGSDGFSPDRGNLLIDAGGNLYGMTFVGGSQSAGTIFKIVPDGTETVFYTFLGGSDGKTPTGGLIADQSGNLYGTTSQGGGTGCGGAGCGTVFKIAPNGTETILYAFSGGADGGEPLGGLLIGQNGLLYGTASIGGAKNNGVVFSVTTQ